MDGTRQKIAIAVAVVVLLGGVAGAVLLLGGGDGVTDAGSSNGDGDSAGNVETTEGDTSESETTATPDMEETAAAFDYWTEEIEECGETCREVTATLQNEGNESADDIVVETNIYTDGDLIWEGDEEVGELDAGESYTSTTEIDLSFTDATKVERNDGWITIETIIHFEDGTEVIVEERQVS